MKTSGTFHILSFIVTLLISWLISGSAYADCTSPAGTEGAIWYDNTPKKVKYCDNTNWITLETTAAGYVLPDGSVPMTGAFLLDFGAEATPGLAFDGDADTGVYRPAADELGFSTGAVEALRIDSSGNVGIGTVTPGAPLHIAAVGAADADPLFQVSEDGNTIFDVTARNGANLRLGPARFFNINQDGAAMLSLGVQNTSPSTPTLMSADSSGFLLKSREDDAGATYGVAILNDVLMPSGVPLLKVGIGGTNTDTATYMVINDVGNVGVGTATPDASALLDVSSTTKGFLPPRMTTTERDAVTTPAEGLTVFNTTTDKLNVYAGGAWTQAGGGSFGSGNSGFVGSLVYPTSANCVWENITTPMNSFAADADCASPVTSGAASAPATKIPGISFTSVPAGRYMLVASNMGLFAASSANCSYSLSDGTTNTGATYIDASAARRQSILVGFFDYSTAQSNITFDIKAAENGGGTCQIYNTSGVNWDYDINFTLTRIDGNGSAIELADDDGNTKVQVEKNADENIIRFDTAGSERMTIDAVGDVSMTGDLTANSFTGDGAGLTNIGASAIADGSITLADTNFGSTNGINIPQLAGDPASPTAGQMYYNTTSNKMMIYDGSGFVEAGSGAGGFNNVFSNSSGAMRYVVFNGDGGAVIYKSGGVSEVVRESAGQYSIKWSTPFADDKYIVLGTCNANGYNGANFSLEGNRISGDTHEAIHPSQVDVGCSQSAASTRIDSDLIVVVAFDLNSSYVDAGASFNGEGGVTTYASKGVSSIVRNSVGDYTVNWSTPFSNDQYVILGSCNGNGTSSAAFSGGGNNIDSDPREGIFAGSAQIACRSTTSEDSDLIHVVAVQIGSGIAAKAATFIGSGSVTNVSSNGVSSVTRTSAGLYEVNWSSAFSSEDYITLGACNAWGTSGNKLSVRSKANGTDANKAIFECRRNTNALNDTDWGAIVAFDPTTDSIGESSSSGGGGKFVNGADSNDAVYTLGNVGIGTTTPQSALQVSGYAQLDTVSGTPPAGDCDTAAERGRMKIDSATEAFWVCMDSGWVNTNKSVPSGTWCGWSGLNNGTHISITQDPADILCEGVNPASSCPAGYSRAVFAMTANHADSSSDTVATCIKN